MKSDVWDLDTVVIKNLTHPGEGGGEGESPCTRSEGWSPAGSRPADRPWWDH